MSKRTDTARVLVQISLRNLVSNRVKSGIVGSIMLFGTMLIVVFTALLDSVETSMERVVTSSLAGQLQVYSSKGRDELALFGDLTASQPDIGEIANFKEVKAKLERVPNVKAIVPMGIGVAIGSGGNDLDRLIAQLRKAIRTGDAKTKAQTIAQLRQIAGLLQGELANRKTLQREDDAMRREAETLKRVTSDAFWQKLDADPQPQLLFLDTRFAPLSTDGRMFFLRYLGTDPKLFAEQFDRFEIERGQKIPEGKRGVLISRRVYEKFLKHRVARQLDVIKEKIEVEGRAIDDDELLQARVRRMSRQYRTILYQLDPRESAYLDKKLREVLPDDAPDDDLAKLIQKFLLVNSGNYYARRDLFYKEIGPRIELYRVKVGDIATLQSFTRRGYAKAVNVRLWGVYQFKGIEDSDLAGVVNLMDMITFRELYGKMTSAQRQELATIRKNVGVKDVKRDNAEDALFGGSGDDSADAVEVNTTETFDEFDDVTVVTRADRLKAMADDTYTTAQLNDGVALNAAIILHDPSKLRETQAALRAAIQQNNMDLKVVNWQRASGVVGQVVVVIRLVLYVAIVIIFLVAAVIINNSMIMATMERVSEIGTMRAIGARRGFVLAMIMLETLVLGAVAATAGALGGVGLILLMNHFGIPATNDIMKFLFAGPRLRPTVGAGNILFALVAVFIISVISTLYPAIVAARVQPVVAMRGRE